VNALPSERPQIQGRGPSKNAAPPIRTMKDLVRKSLLKAFERLLHDDGHLFDCPIEEDIPYDARKLHEVCINHCLAIHLEKVTLPICKSDESIFVDIEFNREGVNFKKATVNGQDKLIRPDIIIHNRITGSRKSNFLVVECKKQGAPDFEISEDRQKVLALRKDERYGYSFGLHVVYGQNGVNGESFFKESDAVISERIDYCSTD
jgi:hypothetical protein